MQYLSDIPAALSAINTYLIASAAALPAPARAAIARSAGQASPVDTIVQTGELLYGLGDGGTAETRALAARLIEFATRYGWHELSADSRGARIMAALLRDLGEDAPIGGWPDPARDPAPREFSVAA